MTSYAKGYLRVPVWIDGDKVTPLVNADGRIPVVLESSDVSLDVNLESSDITLPIDIKSQTITPDINLKTSSITLPIDVKTQSITIDVNLKTSDITLGTTESSPLTSIQSQNYAWDGTSWRKLPLGWGYSDNYIETQVDLTAAVTIDVLTFAQCPEGEVWVVTQWCAVDINTQCSNIILRLTRGAISYNLNAIVPSAADVYVGQPVNVILKKDDRISIVFIGTAANDDIYGWVAGYKMKVAE